MEWSGGAGSCAGPKCRCSVKGPCFGQSWIFLPEAVREEDVGLVSVHSLLPSSSELVAGPGVIAVAGAGSWELSGGMRRGSPAGCAEVPGPAGRVEAPSSPAGVLGSSLGRALWCSGCSGWVPFQGVPHHQALPGRAPRGRRWGPQTQRGPNSEHQPGVLSCPGTNTPLGSCPPSDSAEEALPPPQSALSRSWEQPLAAVARTEPFESTCTKR